jgi:Protein of unknown function (DUF732)
MHALRNSLTWWVTMLLALAAPCACLLWPAAARGDSVAYLIDVTVRPGYNFPDANAALAYGQGVCDKVSGGRSYAQVMADVKSDFTTGDEYQASYLVDKAVNELCPAQIWQLRASAAHYQPPPG